MSFRSQSEEEGEDRVVREPRLGVDPEQDEGAQDGARPGAQRDVQHCHRAAPARADERHVHRGLLPVLRDAQARHLHQRRCEPADYCREHQH